MTIRYSFVLTAICLAGCQYEQPDTKPLAEVIDHGAAIVSDRTGQVLGTVTLTSESDQLVLTAELDGVKPGMKAFHLHTTGLCETPDFTSAGGHLNPEGKSHGSLSETGKHLGDLPNLDIAETGSINTQIAVIGAQAEVLAAMQDFDGTAVVLHAGPDDYISDPAGAAGPRIACGVFEFNS